MKRSLFLIAALVCITSYAQDGLKGTWRQERSSMGVSFTDTMTFSSDNSGKVISNVTTRIAVSILGVKVNGYGEGYLEGNFRYDGDKLTIAWDESTLRFEMVKPITVTRNGKNDPDLEKASRERADEIVRQAREDLAEDKIFSDVHIKGDRLTLKSKNREGKTETGKYTRAK